jgi:ribA/ribD-fused uncharacterized protein
MEYPPIRIAPETIPNVIAVPVPVVLSMPMPPESTMLEYPPIKIEPEAVPNVIAVTVPVVTSHRVTVAVPAVSLYQVARVSDTEPVREEIEAVWRDVARHGYTVPVIAFYEESGPYGCFSNFAQHAPFLFSLPECCARDEVARANLPTETLVTFAEKAIMLCKAAAMSDHLAYRRLLEARTPGGAKHIGRQITGWNQPVWDAVVCTVAREVVLQKFSQVPALTPILLLTGCQVIAEMTGRDPRWGTGIDVGHEHEHIPARYLYYPM